jgi:hypothetical protein
MTTSGTAAFNLDIMDLIEEAYERAGVEARTGYDFRTARRSLNLITAEWANRGLNLWTIEQLTQVVTAGQATYNLPADCIDVIELAVRLTSNGQSTDYTIDRVGVGDYASIPNKATQGRPVQYYVERLTSLSRYTLWPVPDQAYTILYWQMRRMEDAGAGTNTIDIPVRFVPCLAAGLAYHLAMKRPEATNRLQFLKGEYEEQFKLAADEDRDRANLHLLPWIGYS